MIRRICHCTTVKHRAAASFPPRQAVKTVAGRSSRVSHRALSRHTNLLRSSFSSLSSGFTHDAFTTEFAVYSRRFVFFSVVVFFRFSPIFFSSSVTLIPEPTKSDSSLSNGVEKAKQDRSAAPNNHANATPADPTTPSSATHKKGQRNARKLSS